MSFNALETSQQDGRPVELYTFAYQTVTYRYNTSPDPIQFGGFTYEPAAILRGAIKATPEQGRAKLSVTVGADNPVADLFRVQPPSGVVSVTITRLHFVDNDPAVIWKGRVLSVAWQGPRVEMSCEPISTSLKRNGLTRKYQRACPLTLYQCGVNENDFRLALTTFNVLPPGNVINSPQLTGYSDNYFAGGFLTYVRADNGTTEFRDVITNTAGGGVTLNLPPLGLDANSTSVYLLPGCNHTLNDCQIKFNNLVNYGGTPFIPNNNPFGGTTLF